MTFTPARPLPLWGVTQVRFGYPNEEAFRENPRLSPGFDGIGFYEVLNSSWSGEVRDFNRENFPETPEDLGLRHFVWAFKENTLEVLSSGFEAERLPSESHRAVSGRSRYGARAQPLRQGCTGAAPHRCRTQDGASCAADRWSTRRSAGLSMARVLARMVRTFRVLARQSAHRR